MGKIGDLWVKLGLKSAEFEQGISSVQSKTQSFSQKMGSALSSIAGKFLAVTTAVRALNTAIGTIKDFEHANSQLAAVLGKSRDEIKKLTNAALELGRSTEFTASQVTELQTSLARLGFSQSEILDMSEGVLKFASAVGTDLGSAADFTGSALRAFGLDAEDTTALLDIMAASTSKSALDFSKLQTSISIVAPIAKSFGLSVNETAAFLGILANNGFDASSSATALRNILLNLADANGKLAKGIGHSAQSFNEIVAAFGELRERGINVAAVLEMTERKTASAAATIIDNADAVKKLNDELLDAKGTLNQMHHTMTDDLQGSVDKLKSAWEGLTLAFSESKGPMKWVVDMLAGMLTSITDLMTVFERQKEREGLAYARGGFGGQAFGNGGGIESSGGGVRGGEGAPAPEFVIPETEEEREKRLRKEAQALHERAVAAGEVAAADDEMAEAANEAYEAFRKAHDIPTPAIFDNETWLQLAKNMDEALSIFREVPSLADDLADSLDSCTKKAEDGLKKMQITSEQLAQSMSDQLVDALQSGAVAGFDALAEAIAGVDGADATTIMKSLLSPIADMAISLGTMTMLSGEAIESLKKSLATFTGGSAVAAGAALVGIGVAMKAGLSAMAKSGAGASSTTSASVADMGRGDAVSRSELVVTVNGVVKGNDIVISGQNTINGWNR